MVVLPAPFGPSSAKHLAPADVEVDAVDGDVVAVGLAQPAYGDREFVSPCVTAVRIRLRVPLHVWSQVGARGRCHLSAAAWFFTSQQLLMGNLDSGMDEKVDAEPVCPSGTGPG